MRIYVESRIPSSYDKLRAVFNLVDASSFITRVDKVHDSDVTLVYLTNPYDIEYYAPYTPCIYFKQGWVLVYMLPDETVIKTDPSGFDFIVNHEVIQNFIQDIKTSKTKTPMEKSIYLGKSNRANPVVVQEVRQFLNKTDYKIKEYLGGVYTDVTLRQSDYAVFVTDGFILGRGIYEQITLCKAMNKPYLVIIPYNSKFYYAQDRGFHLVMKDSADYFNYAKIDLQNDYSKSDSLDVKDYVGDFIETQESLISLRKGTKKKEVKKATIVIKNDGYPVTPSEAVKIHEAKNPMLLIMRRYFK